jgi:CRISPR/Cas system-associated protein Cas10 (large subunit of type III CRISPR-Cas system)
MSKQTATQYLIEEIKNDSFVQAKSTEEWNEVFKQALQMEREQIEKAIEYVFNYGCRYANGEEGEYDSQPYYEQTYGGKDEIK